MHHPDTVFARERDDFFKERQVNTHRRRVGRKTENQHLRFRETLANRALDFLEKIHVFGHTHTANIRAGDDRAVNVNRVARIRHQRRIAAIQRGEHQVREAFFRADGDDGFGVWVEPSAVALRIPVADGLAQTRNTFRHAIAVGVAAQCGFD